MDIVLVQLVELLSWLVRWGERGVWDVMRRCRCLSGVRTGAAYCFGIRDILTNTESKLEHLTRNIARRILWSL